MTPLPDSVYTFAGAAAAGELDGPWVDVDPDPSLPPHRVRTGPDGRPRFGHLPYAAFLPPPMAEALVAAHRRGEAGLFEAVLVMLARPEWLVASRALWLTPLSPAPRLLSELVEACGVDRAVHRDEAALLARLAALLPGWTPRRGELAQALRLLEDGAGAPPPGRAHQGPGAEDDPAFAPDAELIACRAASWWTARLRGRAAPPLWIRGGALRCVGPRPAGTEGLRTLGAPSPDAADATGAAAGSLPPEAAPLDRLPGDLCLALDPGAVSPARLLRLLPVWTSPRLFLPPPPERP